MPDHIALDILDRPAGGAYRARAALAGATAPGLRALLRLFTGEFSQRRRGDFTPRRMGVLTVWEDATARAGGWEELLGARCAQAAEHWHVEGEVTRVAMTHPWAGWAPDAAGAHPLRDGEPALILISGNLKPRHLPSFARDNAGAVARALAHPGYLGGLGLATSTFNTTSCSCWRSYADVRDYAFGRGAHAAAMRNDRRLQRHATETFLRVRPQASWGTLRGRDPFAGVLDMAASPV